MFNINFDLMTIDELGWFLSSAVFITYGAICVVSVIFTFSLDTYYRIDKLLKLEVFNTSTLTPLDANITWLDNFLFNYHFIAGPVLILLSILDMKFLFEIILKL
jgi:hypothetical protein